MYSILTNTGFAGSSANNHSGKEPFFMFENNTRPAQPFFGANTSNKQTHTDGPPDVQKQPDGGVPPQQQPQPQPQPTPCASSVSIGSLAAFNHSNLPAAEKENWGTYLGITSKMNVGPGPDHSGHCMKEQLTTVSNTCPAQVYSRGGETASQPCAGNRCLDINKHPSAGDAATHSMLGDDATSFIDLHRTRHPNSLLAGSNTNSCSVVCDQVYSCDRTNATTGKFRITRNFQTGTFTKADGTTMPITTGSVTKVLVP